MIPGMPKVVGIIIDIVVLIVAVIIHEVAHGWAAEKRGDPTARRLGRITLNPLPHIDLVGSILIPLSIVITSMWTGGLRFMLGWAKPVPIDIRRFRSPLQDYAVVALAGPAANLLQFLLYVALFRVATAGGWPLLIQYFALSGAGTNFVLAIFNLIPIPPLDGSRLVAAALPTHLAIQYLRLDRYGFMIILALLFLGVISRILGSFEPLFSAIVF